MIIIYCQLMCQTSTAKDRGLFGQYSLGWDYDLGKNQALSAGLRYGTRNFLQKQKYLYMILTLKINKQKQNQPKF